MSADAQAQDFDIVNACLQGQTALVRQVLSRNPDLVAFVDPSSSRRPLHIAASQGHVDTAVLLLENGAEIDHQDEMGATALISAGLSGCFATQSVGSVCTVSAGSSAIVRTLVARGANVNTSNSKQISPLHYAASKGRVEIGRLLIDAGADINARDSANQLPLHRAASIGSVPFVQLLTRKPAEGEGARPKPRLNLQDRSSNTPLHLAIESGHGEAAVALIEAGADRQRTNSDGQRPEEIAGVGGQEGRRLLQYIHSHCGPLDD